MTGFKASPSRVNAGEGPLSPLDIDGRRTVLSIYGRALTVVLSVARRDVFVCCLIEVFVGCCGRRGHVVVRWFVARSIATAPTLVRTL